MPRGGFYLFQANQDAFAEAAAREAAARATEEAEAAAPTALPAPETSAVPLQSISAVADANAQGEEEYALVMTSKEIKEMRRAEKKNVARHNTH